MVKQITKYYCDLCGKEHPLCRKYSIPDIEYKEVHDAHNISLRKELSYIAPFECDICPNCASLIFYEIMKIKKIVNE